MDETVRRVAWAIAESWWRMRNRVAAGAVPEATSSRDYADNFWQGWTEQAKAALAAAEEGTRVRPGPSLGNTALSPLG